MDNVQYRHARRQDLSLIDVMSLPIGMPKKDRPQGLTCPGCGDPVRPRLGMKRPRHFYHHRSAPTHTCSGESYLHQAGKKALAEAMERLIATGRSLTLFHPKGLRHRYHSWDGRLYRTESEKGERRLMTRGATVEVERGEGGFVADVRMRSGEETIFLEVAVTHPCSAEKIATGIPILEFDIQSEEDIARMVALVRTGNLQVGGRNAVARTFNLGLGRTQDHVDKPSIAQVVQAADKILNGLFWSGRPVTLMDGTNRVVPQRGLGPYGVRKQPVIATTESFVPELFRHALENYETGLLALLPDDVEQAAKIVLNHLSREKIWKPDLIPMNPFTSYGGLSQAIPKPIRDRLTADGIVAEWRALYGIEERDAPAPPEMPVAAIKPAAASSIPTRDLTFSLSRQGRLCATSDGRTFGALIGTFPVEDSKPDIWALDQVMRGKLGKAGFVRSCLNCRNHAFWSGGMPIFCMRKKNPCHQTDAVGCTSWSWMKDDAELAAHRRRIADNPKAPALARIMAH